MTEENKTCPWCDELPKPSKGFGPREYIECKTDGCWLHGVMATPDEWNNRLTTNNKE